MNTITFALHPYADLPWRQGVTETIDILIDGRNLIDMVREIELPFATAEGSPDMAGAYTGLLANRPDDLLDALLAREEDFAGSEGTNAVLICAGCGELGCWPLTVRITMDDKTVTWSGFEQPHRIDPAPPGIPWRYDNLGPFVFDHGEYERGIAMCTAKYRHAAYYREQ